MAECISPFYKKESGMSFPCGKCYCCKARRVSGWSFRLLKEAERSDSALFVTLTYSDTNLPLTKNNWPTLVKKDLQLFFKRLRINTERSTKNKIWDKKIKYYAAGEYGDKRQRPHYHIIIFNAEYHNIEESWKLGKIHYGELTAASAAYTLKYISKSSYKKPWKPYEYGPHQKDDRSPEFSLMSKRLGDNYLTPHNIAWHRKRSKDGPIHERYFLPLTDGKKVAMPRYYKAKIWNKFETQLIGAQFVKYSQDTYDQKNDAQKLAFDQKNEQLREYYAHINKETRSTTL